MTSFKVVKTDISIFYLMVKRTVYLIKIIEHLLTVTPLPLMNKKSAQCVCVCVCVCNGTQKNEEKRKRKIKNVRLIAMSAAHQTNKQFISNLYCFVFADNCIGKF
jgi:hypothetical protein